MLIANVAGHHEQVLIVGIGLAEVTSMYLLERWFYLSGIRYSFEEYMKQLIEEMTELILIFFSFFICQGGVERLSRIHRKAYGLKPLLLVQPEESRTGKEIRGIEK